MDCNLSPTTRLQAVMFCASIYRGFRVTQRLLNTLTLRPPWGGERTTSQAVLKCREEAASFPRSRFKLRRVLLRGRAGSEGLADM